MDFEWDPEKSERNVLIRGLSFEVATKLFDARVIQEIDDRMDYGEVRIRAIGEVEGRIFRCVFTDRGSVRRIISFRLANRREQNAFRAAQSS